MLHSTGWDLGIYDQAAWQMSQGLSPVSTLHGLHHMGNHGAWMFYAVAPLYRLAPSVHWLFLTQALGLILAAWPLWRLAAQAGLKTQARWLICWLYWLQPVVFNVNLFDFHPETWAMPLLALAVWASRTERRWLWLMALFAAMGCRDGLSLIVIGLALEQALRRRWRWAVEALVLGVGWLLFLVKGLYPALNDGAGPAALIRYQHLCRDSACEGIGDILRSALLDPVHLLSALDWSTIVPYLLALMAPLFIFWRLRSLPMLVAVLPLLAANVLSSLAGQRDLASQYSLPLAVLLVVASIDGLRADRLQARFWLLENLSLGYLVAALCWVLLTNFHYFFDRYQTLSDYIQPAQEIIGKIPDDAGVLTYNWLIPQLSQRPVIVGVTTEQSRPFLLEADIRRGRFLVEEQQLIERKLDMALLYNDDSVTSETLQRLGWSCAEENSVFVLCQKPTGE